MPPKAKGQVKRGAVTRSATGRNTINTVTYAGKRKKSSVETRSKMQSSKGEEASPESSDEERHVNSSEDESSLTPTVSASKITNALDIEDAKREAFNMIWSADLSDDMAKRFKQPKRVWDEASTWAELVSGNDPEYASRLRYSY